MKGTQFFRVDVGALVLLETEDEKPPVALIRRNEGSRSTAFASASEPDPLLDDAAAQISVDQSSNHFFHRLAQRPVRQPYLARPTTEVAGLNTPFMSTVCH